MRVSAQQASQDLIAESERLAAALESEQSTVEALRADNAELSGRLAQLAKDLEEVKAEAAAQREAAGLARTEKAKLELRLEGVPRLESEIERLKAALESERDAKVAAEQKSAVAQARLQSLEAQLNEVNSTAPRLAAELASLKTSLDEERAARTTAQQQAAVALAKLEKTEAQAADLGARLAKAEDWLDEARGKGPQAPESSGSRSA